MLKSVEKWLCEKRKKLWLMAPLHLIRHFEVLKKNSSTIFFYRTFNLNPKFQLIFNQIDLDMENLCLAAILIFSAILFFIIRFTLNSIASGTVFSYNCSPIIRKISILLKIYLKSFAIFENPSH
jgi:hypothetical protein